MRWKIRLNVGSPKNGGYVEVYKFKLQCSSPMHTNLSCFHFFFCHKIQQRLRLKVNMENSKIPKMPIMFYSVSIKNFCFHFPHDGRLIATH